MVLGRRTIGAEARRQHADDSALAERLPELLEEVQRAESALREAHDVGAEPGELHRAGVALDSALTDAMRAAYAKERSIIGPRGYEDRLYRRKRQAKPVVKEATGVAQHLLTMRETHRLHGIERVPRNPAGV